MSTMESASKISCTTSLWQVCALSSYVGRVSTVSAVVKLAAYSTGLLRAPRLQHFVGREFGGWETNAVLKITDDSPNVPAPVNPSTLPAPVPIITVLGPWQGTDSFLKKNQNVACLRDRSPHGYDHGDSIRHIIVKTVYAMRFSCSGVAVGQSQQIVKRI